MHKQRNRLKQKCPYSPFTSLYFSRNFSPAQHRPPPARGVRCGSLRSAYPAVSAFSVLAAVHSACPMISALLLLLPALLISHLRTSIMYFLSTQEVENNNSPPQLPRPFFWHQPLHRCQTCLGRRYRRPPKFEAAHQLSVTWGRVRALVVVVQSLLLVLGSGSCHCRIDRSTRFPSFGGATKRPLMGIRCCAKQKG